MKKHSQAWLAETELAIVSTKGAQSQATTGLLEQRQSFAIRTPLSLFLPKAIVWRKDSYHKRKHHHNNCWLICTVDYDLFEHQ